MKGGKEKKLERGEKEVWKDGRNGEMRKNRDA